MQPIQHYNIQEAAMELTSQFHNTAEPFTLVPLLVQAMGLA